VKELSATENELLTRAIEGPGHAGEPPLPDDVAQLLRDGDAAPRLAAHLRLVRAAAVRLVDWLAAEFGSVPADREAVLFGAATHDIGKTVFPGELSGPGKEHEPAGRRLLLEHGYPERLARFAGTHGTWTAPEITLDDLLVSLADKAWKGARVDELERLTITAVATLAGREEWEVMLSLDDVLTSIGDDADDRLRFQGAFPTTH